MALKIFMVLISVSFFFWANIIPGGKGNIVQFILKLFTLFISFLSGTVLFTQTARFQEMLGERFVKKIIIILLLIGPIYFLAISFLLHGSSSNYVVSPALDPISYFIQAKIFAATHINVPSHELKDFFTTGYCINDGKYYSMYFPGWPLLLSIGVALGLPWIINPIFGVLTLIIIYFTGKEIYDSTTGLFAAVLLMVSNNYYLLTPEYMSEPSSLFFSSLFFYLMVKTLKNPNILTSSLAGISLGIIFLIRPFSAVAIALPVMGYSFFSSIKKRRKNMIHFAIIILTFLPIFCVFFLYNYFQTGSIFLTPTEYYNPHNILGFGLRSSDAILKAHIYTLFEALKNLSINLALLNWESVLFLFIILLPVLINKKNKWDVILFATVSTIIFLYIFYHFRSIRYYYVSYFALFLLAARGINLVEVLIKNFFPDASIKNLNCFLLLFILVANIFIISPPQHAIKRYELYQRLRDPFIMVREKNLKNSVVFLKSVPEPYNNISYYVQNPLDFSGDVLFARDLKEKNIELMNYYPEKEFYYYDYYFKSKSGKLSKINKN